MKPDFANTDLTQGMLMRVCATLFDGQQNDGFCTGYVLGVMNYLKNDNFLALENRENSYSICREMLKLYIMYSSNSTQQVQGDIDDAFIVSINDWYQSEVIENKQPPSISPEEGIFNIFNEKDKYGSFLFTLNGTVINTLAKTQDNLTHSMLIIKEEMGTLFCEPNYGIYYFRSNEAAKNWFDEQMRPGGLIAGYRQRSPSKSNANLHFFYGRAFCYYIKISLLNTNSFKTVIAQSGNESTGPQTAIVQSANQGSERKFHIPPALLTYMEQSPSLPETQREQKFYINRSPAAPTYFNQPTKLPTANELSSNLSNISKTW